MTFDEWWKEMKPAECDELKGEFFDCWLRSKMSSNAEVSTLKTELHAISVALDDPRTDLIMTMVEVIAELKVVSDHNLATYHQAAELLRAEIADLRRAGLEWHGKFITETAATELLREQVTMLRDALEFIPESGSMLGHAAEMKRKAALAATADLSGLILCHAEPIAHMYQHDETGRTTFVAMPDRMSERRWYEIPLYRAWEPK